ncbi:MAG: sulfite exporter TauE/SafE family protein [Pseudanabaena sp. CAN_BIN31]|nr:sulfite exporter TauE/SafE family protein [Pseudanabaena sp. CAN_BIN31]
MSEFLPIVYLSVVSFFAWIVSTLAGGGSPFILIPLVNSLMGAAAVPPVITIGMFFGNAHRVLLFWRDIDWELTAWYAPSAIVGAILGAYTFTQIHLDWLQIVIAIFLIVSALLFELEKSPEPKSVEKLVADANQNLELITNEESAVAKPKFQLQAWHIMPAGFLKAYVSGLVGTTGPVLNPFYLRYGLMKEKMIATKAAHMTIIHAFKLITYVAFAAISKEQLIAGLAIGLAAIPANLVGKALLKRMSPHQFRQIVLTFMAVGGSWMLWGQKDLFFNLF